MQRVQKQLRPVELPLCIGDLILHSLVGLEPPRDGSGVSLRSSGIEKKSLILDDGFQNQYIWYFLCVL